MEPTLVRLGIMDSSRPSEVVTVRARHLRRRDRVVRALARSAAVTGGGLLVGNVALLAFPFPHVHFCLFPLSLVLGPIVAVASFRHRAVLAAGPLHCPRCRAEVHVPDGLAGWPARFNCLHCGIMVQLDPATGS